MDAGLGASGPQGVLGGVHESFSKATTNELAEAYTRHVANGELEEARSLIDREIEHVRALLRAIVEFDRLLESDL